jgi:hypothetical protein
MLIKSCVSRCSIVFVVANSYQSLEKLCYKTYKYDLMSCTSSTKPSVAFR